MSRALVTVLLLTLALALPAHATRLDSVEQRILEYTNSERQSHGLAPLVLDGSLTEAARAHSEEMARLEYFSHESPTPGHEKLRQRTSAAGCRAREVGENIAYYDGYSPDQVAQQVVTDWMNSPGHRANILRPSFRAIGIGVASNGRKILATQDFASGGGNVSDDAPPPQKKKRWTWPWRWPWQH